MKKKRQKPRKPKEKSDNVSLEKTSKAFRSSGPELESFLDEMIRWFSERQQQVDEVLSHSDPDRSGSVTLKDFQLGVMKLGVSCQQFQLRLLTELLRTDDSVIGYRDLSGRLQGLRLRGGSEINTRVSVDSLAPHQLLDPGKDRHVFIRLSVRLIPFDFAAAHPGSFEVVLLISSRVFSLIRIIQDRVGIQTSRLEVFRSRAPREEARLPPESSLVECGFRGGPEETPAEDTVYYDYTLMFTDCPVLNCDHYFRSAPDKRRQPP